MNEHFSEPKFSGEGVTVELDSSNCATKADLKNATRLNTSKFVKKLDLANLNSDVYKLDINKLKNVPCNLNNLKTKVHKLDVDKLVSTAADLSKLSDAVKNAFVKKDIYNAKITNILYKIPDITNLATNTTRSAKLNRNIT